MSHDYLPTSAERKFNLRAIVEREVMQFGGFISLAGYVGIGPDLLRRWCYSGTIGQLNGLAAIIGAARKGDGRAAQRIVDADAQSR